MQTLKKFTVLSYFCRYTVVHKKIKETHKHLYKNCSLISLLFQSKLVSFHVSVSVSAFLCSGITVSHWRRRSRLFQVLRRPHLALQSFHLARLQCTKIHLLHVNSSKPSAKSITRYVLLLLWLQCTKKYANHTKHRKLCSDYTLKITNFKSNLINKVQFTNTFMK